MTAKTYQISMANGELQVCRRFPPPDFRLFVYPDFAMLATNKH